MPTILVVEDNLALAQCLSIELETEGFVAEITPDGAEALKRIRQPEPIDLVLLDWDLPDFSGLELLQLMRKNNYVLPVMMLTAHDAVDHKVGIVQLKKVGDIIEANEPLCFLRLRKNDTHADKLQSDAARAFCLIGADTRIEPKPLIADWIK